MAANNEKSAGRRIGGYEVERELGQGGMGVVYLARQPDLERRCVLKTLRRDRAAEPTQRERFQREAQAAGSIHHQNVVAVFDCFAWRGEHYIAQEYVEGADLSSALARVGRFEPRVAGVIALELVRGLEEIHACGLVHRDLKPQNILLGRAGQAKIADFGIALDPNGPALTQTGHSIGTPPYMSPEQFLGERVDARSDLFSFGVVLYEMLVGETPFRAGGPEEGEALIRRVEAERYTPPRELAPKTSRYLARLIKACLRSRTEKRIASSHALRRALERHLASPSPADCRAEIAAWLYEHKALPDPPRETIVLRQPVQTATAATPETSGQQSAELATGSSAPRQTVEVSEADAALMEPICPPWLSTLRWMAAALLLGVLITSAVVVDLNGSGRGPLPALLASWFDGEDLPEAPRASP